MHRRELLALATSAGLVAAATAAPAAEDHAGHDMHTAPGAGAAHVHAAVSPYGSLVAATSACVSAAAV